MVDYAEVCEVELIPDEDSVSRGCDLPPGMDPESVFPFSSDPTTGEKEESVYWRKYADTIESVHARGCQRIELTNKRRVLNGQVPRVYIGAITASVGAIRHIKTQRGFSLMVNHLPEDGERAHTHICVLEPSDAGKVRLKANDRRELVHKLCSEAFGDIEKHNCGS